VINHAQAAGHHEPVPPNLRGLACRALGVLPGAARFELYEPFGAEGPSAYVATHTATMRSVLVMSLGAETHAWYLPHPSVRPGHGLLMLPFIRVTPGSRVLDLGCGPFGLHGVFSKNLGAGHVVCSDIDASFVAHVAALTEQRSAIHTIEADLLCDGARGRFALVTFHPPVLPTGCDEVDVPRGHALCYHFGGPRGRTVLDRGIAQIAERLVPRGVAVIGHFEFLGGEQRFGTDPTTAERLAKAGMVVEEIYHRRVAMTPVLKDRLLLLRKLFPGYDFEDRGATTWHRFSIVVARRRGRLALRRPTSSIPLV